MLRAEFTPKLVTALREGIGSRQLTQDLMAGVIVGVVALPLIVMERSGFLDAIGEDNVHANIDDALDRARDLLGLAREPHPQPFVPTVQREVKTGP